MTTKKEILQMHLSAKDMDSALKVASKFYRDFTASERMDIQISSECINNESRQRFYQQVGHNVEQCRKRAEDALNNWYSNSVKVKI